MYKKKDSEHMHNNIVSSYQEDLQENDISGVNPMLTSSPAGKQKNIVQSSEKCLIDPPIWKFLKHTYTYFNNSINIIRSFTILRGVG